MTDAENNPSNAEQPIRGQSPAARLRPYIRVLRFDHWCKNVFMLLGTLLAVFMEDQMPPLRFWPILAVAFVITGFIASSNYVINELLDATRDRYHPDKKDRPIACGQIGMSAAYALWVGMGAIGVIAAWQINRGFGVTGSMLWIMGCLYNIPPVRTKEIPYLDVLTESINNPLRLLLGWFVLIPDRVPPLSLVLSYWMLGAFFMAVKRYAEYRMLGDPEQAGRYRGSFRWYTEERLLVSSVFYSLVGACFAGVFIVRYHLELVLFLPISAAYVAYYLRIGLQPNSPVQAPEKLYREHGFVAISLFTLAMFVLLMLIHIPALYDAFNVDPARLAPLWTID